MLRSNIVLEFMWLGLHLHNPFSDFQHSGFTNVNPKLSLVVNYSPDTCFAEPVLHDCLEPNVITAFGENSMSLCFCFSS